MTAREREAAYKDAREDWIARGLVTRTLDDEDAGWVLLFAPIVLFLLFWGATALLGAIGSAFHALLG